ncbi:MAG TPA: PP2C family protein-serine/threonine phosphatase [Blastocatellia bacterium]|nr:PP2C family protein-serine/threonine phosphatase [Blastocatellia bacterium]
MGQTEFSGALASRLVVGSQPKALSSRAFGAETREQELELKLAALQKSYADLHAALSEASQVYRRLCGPRFVRLGDFEIASETFAARHVPGDFIAVEDTGSSALLALGDISGKGLSAGMWTTLLLGLLGIHRSAAEPELIVAAVNRDLCQSSIGAPLASLFLGKLDSDTGTLDYCSAGHPPALLLREDGLLELLSEGGPLLGVVSDASFVKGSVELREGDVLVVYSDGIVEAHNGSEHEFGFEYLERQLRSAQGGSTNAILFSILGAVQDFVNANPQADDMSLVVVQRRY